MRFKKYLNEKSYAIGADVDMIYKQSFAKYEKIFRKGNFQEFIAEIKKSEDMGNGKFLFNEIDSSELKSKQCKIAHDINPIKIQCGILSGNAYVPDKNLVRVTLHPGATNLLIHHNVKSAEDLKPIIGSSDERERFMNEFSAASLKGSIYHELSHWINDSKHNFHITKMVNKAKEMDDASLLTKHGSNLFTDYEIDAQVHAIKQLKRHFNSSWDGISWKDIVQFKPSFGTIRNQLQKSSPEVQKDYFKRMTRRLNRENLLGKTMQKTFKYMI